jgi:glycosyltransferase involved in cell wall biosynthesis
MVQFGFAKIRHERHYAGKLDPGLSRMISIIFITHNRREELVRAARSCQGRFREKGEIIVVDNGSNDGTEKAVRTLLSKSHIPLVYIRNETNQGVAEARNIGYRAAQGDILFFLDDDAYIVGPSDALSRCASLMRRGKIAALGTRIVNLRTNTEQKGVTARSAGAGDLQPVSHFIGAAHFINKDRVKGESLYPPHFFYGCEERYLCFRLFKKGESVLHYQGMTVHHEPSRTTRIPGETIELNNLINLAVVKLYVAPRSFIPVIVALFFLRAVKLGAIRSGLYSKIIRQFFETYHCEFVSRISVRSYIHLIHQFGHKATL